MQAQSLHSSDLAKYGDEDLTALLLDVVLQFVLKLHHLAAGPAIGRTLVCQDYDPGFNVFELLPGLAQGAGQKYDSAKT